MAEVYVRLRKAKVASTTTLGQIVANKKKGQHWEPNVVCDWSKSGRLVGIEVLGAEEVTINGRKADAKPYKIGRL